MHRCPAILVHTVDVLEPAGHTQLYLQLVTHDYIHSRLLTIHTSGYT